MKPSARRAGRLAPYSCLVLLAPMLLAACAAADPRPCAETTSGREMPGPAGDVVYVVAHGWHTDIGLPADEMKGPLGVFRGLFPGARVLMFGFGKRTFFTARVETLSELVLGPFPGPGAILATGLSAPPDLAYHSGEMVTLRLPPGGADALSAFLWESIATEAGVPRRIAPGFFPGSVFYASARSYSGAYTCNTWSVQALQAAKLPVTAGGVVFAGQVMDRLRAVADRICVLRQP